MTGVFFYVFVVYPFFFFFYHKTKQTAYGCARTLRKSWNYEHYRPDRFGRLIGSFRMNGIRVNYKCSLNVNDRLGQRTRTSTTMIISRRILINFFFFSLVFGWNKFFALLANKFGFCLNTAPRTERGREKKTTKHRS